MKSVVDRLIEKVEALIAGTDLFLTELTIKPTNNIKVFLDSDTAVTIDTTSKINRALYKQIEEEAIFPNGNFSLEVSSAGVGTPLKLSRQYKKNVGRRLCVTSHDESVVEGLLIEANEDFIVIEAVEGKKKEKKDYKIVISNIKKAVVQVSF